MSNSLNPQNITLMLIDDDPNLVLLAKDYLEFCGYTIITAANGLDAMHILKVTIPDLIICDVMMPGMDGIEFIDDIRKSPKLAWLPVIFLSAKRQLQDRIEGLHKGADVYMVKPFEPEELVAQIESSLNQLRRLQNKVEYPLKTMPLGQRRDVGLTPTETKVVRFVSQGLSNREIAEQLKVSQRTVESHVSNMLNKTNFKNRTELARWAMESRLV